MKRNNTITEILGHDVSWFVDSNRVDELDETSIQHIKECIEDDITQGDLHVCYGKNGDKEASGWWHVINWRSIALDLYNASKSAEIGGLKINTLGMKQAIAKFDDEWTF